MEACLDSFLTKIEINQLRHLRDLEIVLSEKERCHLVLTGKNGSGKTSLLLALNQWLADIPPRSVLMKVMNRRGLETGELHLSYSGLTNPQDLVFGFYEAKRLTRPIIPNGIEKVDLGRTFGVKYKPGSVFLQYLVNLKAERSFASDDQDFKAVEKIDRWFVMFEKCLRNLFSDPKLKLVFDRKNYYFNILQTGHEPFGFDTLSDGYAAILTIVSDLIMKMEGFRSTELYDLQGLVLIDEIEAHLHIELQKKIFPFLVGFFPNIQFIVTTHSPFVLSSAQNAVVYDLEKQIQVQDLSAYSYDALVESYFNIDKYSNEIKKQMAVYEELTQKDELSEEEEDRMFQLRKKLKGVPPDLAPELAARFHELEAIRRKRRV